MDKYRKENKLRIKEFYPYIAIALLLAAGGYKLGNKTDSKENVYLVDITDKYEDELVLLDDNGNNLKIDTSDPSKLLALVTSEKTKKGKQYDTVIINEEGKMFSGEVDGKYLDNKAIDEIEVNNESILEEVNIVSAKSGLWLREDDSKTIDHDTEKAHLLEPGSYVATSDIFETSKSNSYKWKESVYYDGESLKHGYLVGDYIIPTNFSEVEGKRFNVNLGGDTPLKLRDGASTESNIVHEMTNGTEVVLLPNMSSYSDGLYDWFYVAINTDEGIKTGYVAATWHTEAGDYNYLIEKNTQDKAEEQVKQPKEEMIMKIVDTSNVGYADLKLREQPCIEEGNIIAELENETEVYTYQSLIDSAIESDNFNWVKVYLINGTTGYVASQYLNDIKTDYQMDPNSSAVTINFDGEGNKTGYFGIDIQNTIGATEFEKLVSQNHNYNVPFSVKKDLSQMQKPEFVIFKLGATYTSVNSKKATLANENYVYLDNLQSMVAICEEKQIPYGFYYYSQAISEEDIDIEANYINDALSKLGTSTYHILPLAIDVEDEIYYNGAKPTRALVSTQQNGKSYQTAIINKLMNRVRAENNIEVISYLSRSGYARIINNEELDEINRQNPWIVDPSKAHSNDFATNYPSVSENAVIRQIALDGFVNNVPIDVNLIDKEYFESLLRKNNLISKNNSNGKVLGKRN